jgi:hypothetical protein
MLTLERDGTLLNHGRDTSLRARIKETIDLPAFLVMYDGDLIDRLFDVVFERLDRCVIELRIYDTATSSRRGA